MSSSPVQPGGTLEHRFTFPLPNGLHARPASHLEARARRFESSIALRNERNGNEADAKSVLALISGDIRHGDPVCLAITGPDRDVALAALSVFLRGDFLHCDEPLPHDVSLPEIETVLPRSLRAAAPDRVLAGRAVCSGLAEGKIVRVGALTLSPQLEAAPAGSAEEELDKFLQGRQKLEHRMELRSPALHGTEKEILEAHAAILRDPALASRIALHLRDQAGNLAQALMASVGEFSATLQQAENPYLRERVLDLQDVAAQILSEVYGSDAVAPLPVLDAPSIIVAENLTPGQFLALDRKHLRGLVLQHAGTTSHTVILARSFAIPTLTGVTHDEMLVEGEHAVLDGGLGLLLPVPNEATRRFYQREERTAVRHRSTVERFRHDVAASRDGRRLPLLANVVSAEEVSSALHQGAEGVGLFRTEMLFMDRDSAPEEEEQFEIYAAAARSAEGRPVTIRTMDIGGDKPVPYLALPSEANPFLGCRGARLYPELPHLIRAQLRALLRAAAHGSIRIMAPMISVPEEMIHFRKLVSDVIDELKAEDRPVAECPIGMMLEVPSAVLCLPELAPHVDFFSVGTNDLIQYFLAADRDNSRVAALYSPHHPAVLRLLKQAVDAAHAHDRPIGLCGELGEQASALPLLLGLGFDSISMGSPRILEAKAALSRLDSTQALELLHRTLACADRAAVETQLQAFSGTSATPPILAINLIDLDSPATTKHETIRELVDLLVADGRIADAVPVEEAIWQREETYSTGFGYGFAVPHCKSKDVAANSISLVRLRKPVEWGSSDDLPVRVVFLLTIRAADQGKEHMRIFSRLSRLIMRDEFRESLEKAIDAQAVFGLLQTELEIPA